MKEKHEHDWKPAKKKVHIRGNTGTIIGYDIIRGFACLGCKTFRAVDIEERFIA